MSGKLDKKLSRNLTATLDEASKETGMSEAEVLLAWAYYRLNGIVVTTTTKAERASRIVELLSSHSSSLSEHALATIEEGARKDGYDGKVFYKHPHMEKAKAKASH